MFKFNEIHLHEEYYQVSCYQVPNERIDNPYQTPSIFHLHPHTHISQRIFSNDPPNSASACVPTKSARCLSEQRSNQNSWVVSLANAVMRRPAWIPSNLAARRGSFSLSNVSFLSLPVYFCASRNRSNRISSEKEQKDEKWRSTRTTIVFYTHTTTICAYVPVSLSLYLSLISYTLQSRLRAILFSLRAYRRVYLSRHIERRYTLARIIRKTSPIMIMLLYDPDVPFGTFDLGAEVRTWSVRRVLPSRGILISFMLDRAPRRYRSITGDLIFLPREISLNAPLPYFLSLAYVKGWLKPRASRTLQELLSCRSFERRTLVLSFFLSSVKFFIFFF